MDICITQYNLYRTPLTYKKDFEKKKKTTDIHPSIHLFFIYFYLFIYLFYYTFFRLIFKDFFKKINFLQNFFFNNLS